VVGPHTEPVDPIRIVYVGGPWDAQQDTLELPGGMPTILPVDARRGCYFRADLLPDGRWRMAWRGVRGWRGIE
jgi:hypothetical protein